MDIVKLLQQLSTSTGIPIAMYEGEKLICEYGTFHPNPAYIIMKKLRLAQNGVFYTITPDYMLCGYIAFEDKKIVIGPVLFYKCTHKIAKDILFLLQQDNRHESEVMRWFRNMPTCNKERFISALLFIKNIIGHDTPNNAIQVSYPDIATPKSFNTPNLPFINHLDDKIEKNLLFSVETGDVSEMKRIIYPSNANVSDFGKLAENAVQSFKNTFIMSASLVSRAAIKGGLDYTTAITIFDEYIVKLEKLNNYHEILNLIQHMFMDYTRRTAKLQLIPYNSAIAIRVCRYILNHINDKIRLSDIANDLDMNPSYLSRVFKQKTGITISNYISQKKTDEAKRLLENTNLSILAISNRLGFSDQHYFQSIFKKYTGTTPRAYRIDIRYNK